MLRRTATIPALVLLIAGCMQSSPDDKGNPTTSAPEGGPQGTRLTGAELSAFAGHFDDQPYQGGQVAPRLSKWVNQDAYVFLQFDKFPLANATSVRYVGIGVRGTFCKETQPDAANGSFPHFHRWTSPTYAQGHGGPPGAEGYWLSWIAVDSFAAGERAVKPGVDYAFSPTPPPTCGANAPQPSFQAPDAENLTGQALQTFAAAFDDQPYQGGQVAPRLSKWVTPDTYIFIQFDKFPAKDATAVRYVGLGVRSEFCQEARQSTDFTHFHRWNAAHYSEGHAGPPHAAGYWLLWGSLATFEAQGRHVAPGVDRAFSPTAPPTCG